PTRRRRGFGVFVLTVRSVRVIECPPRGGRERDPCPAPPQGGGSLFGRAGRCERTRPNGSARGWYNAVRPATRPACRACAAGRPHGRRPPRRAAWTLPWVSAPPSG